MSRVVDVLKESLDKFLREFDAEIRQLSLETRNHIVAADVGSIVAELLALRPFWGFMLSGDLETLLQLARAAKPEFDEDAVLWDKLCDEKKVRLKKYVRVFVNSVKELADGTQV